jgi:anti-sigma B factor antagonist
MMLFCNDICAHPSKDTVMIVVKENCDQTIILTPQPGVDSSTAKQFEDTLLAAIGGSGGKVLIDCSDLDYISSAGLRTIIIGARAAKAKGGKLILCAMKSHIRTVFDTSGFAKLVPIVGTREDAVFTA